MSPEEKNNRRVLLKSFLIAGGGLGAASLLSNSQQTNEEKIKMLTADGKLVEVSKSVIEKNAGPRKASDKEVLEWMNKNRKS